MRLYIELTNDIGALPLLNFYRCYRAMVRCKVNCLRYHESGNDLLLLAAHEYLSLAHDYATVFSRPILWVVCGLPASGKSTIAGALAEVFDINVIRSDVIRKALFADSTGPSTDSGFGRGLYSAYATEVTYGQLFALAQEELKKGKSVVIDATFSRTVQREEVLRIAAYRQATPAFVECNAAEAILAARLRKRESEPSISDARLIHLQAFKQRFEPMARIDKEIHIRVDTENAPAVNLRKILLTEVVWDGAPPKGGKHV
jgi:predicted kinase